MIISGVFYDGTSSRRRAAELHVTGGAAAVHADGVELVPYTPLRRLQISSRLGNTPRYIQFPNGAKFETADNDAIDHILADSPWQTLLHRLESRMRYALLGLAVTIAVSWMFVRHGIPWLAEAAAFALPPSVNAQIGRGVLEFLDAQLLKPTELDEETRARIAKRFATIIAQAPEDYAIQVEFRSARNTIGANALALPSGTIIFTDELVRLARHDDELAAVLAHEMGHVVQRHGLRRALQGSALALLSVLVLGDIASVSSIATALPLILLELGYSREYEREADAFALATLQRNNIGVHRFIDILQRLERAHRCGDRNDGGTPEKCPDRNGNDGSWAGSSYLATHPPTEERVRFFRNAAAGTP